MLDSNISKDTLAERLLTLISGIQFSHSFQAEQGNIGSDAEEADETAETKKTKTKRSETWAS